MNRLLQGLTFKAKKPEIKPDSHSTTSLAVETAQPTADISKSEGAPVKISIEAAPTKPTVPKTEIKKEESFKLSGSEVRFILNKPY